MATIAESNNVHTVIVVFTVAPEDQEALVERMHAVAVEHSTRDGFVSCSIHRSEDGTRVAEYIQWRTREHWQAMMSSPAGAALLNESPHVADAHVYEVASVVEVPVVPGALADADSLEH